MINQEVIINQQLQETIHYDNLAFPVARFIDQLDYFADHSFLCHWHTEYEIAIVLSGCVEYQLDQKTYRVGTGEGLIINSQVLHSARQLTPGSVIFNIEFLPTFFSQYSNSIVYQKYFRSSLFSNIVGYHLVETEPQSAEILQCLRQINLLRTDDFFYELTCLEHVLHIWRNLLILFEKQNTALPTFNSFSAEHRIRKMIAYIQSGFAGPITIESISSHANISRSECFRCFMTFCHMTPMEYVNQYRLQRAAQKLAAEDASVSEIGVQCGFSTTSYFGKAFRKAYGMTPSAFRKTLHQESGA